MTETPTPRRRRRTAKKSTAGAKTTITVHDEPGSLTELTVLQKRWTRLMEQAAGYAGDQMIRVVLRQHGPDAEGHCTAEKCRGALWPCPPAASVIAKLP